MSSEEGIKEPTQILLEYLQIFKQINVLVLFLCIRSKRKNNQNSRSVPKVLS